MDNTNFKEACGKRLKLFIAFKGLTQKSFAESVGVEPTTLSRVISGNNGISSDLSYAIICVYPELSWNWLLKEQGMMTNSSESANLLEEPELRYQKLVGLAVLEEQVRSLKKELELKDEIIALLKEKSDKMTTK